LRDRRLHDAVLELLDLCRARVGADHPDLPSLPACRSAEPAPVAELRLATNTPARSGSFASAALTILNASLTSLREYCTPR
jgi:hypothetical protein